MRIVKTLLFGVLFLSGCFSSSSESDKSSGPSVLAQQDQTREGVFGISPTQIELRWKQNASYTGVRVYSVESGTKQVVTTSAKGIISVLKNRTYFLKVHGMSSAGIQSTSEISSYQFRTWDTFDRATWEMTSDSNDVISGSVYKIQWSYEPWKDLAPGDGVTSNTIMRCYFTSDAGTVTTLDGLVEAKSMVVSAASINQSGNVKVNCEVRYADGTVSQNTKFANFVFRPAIKSCTTSENSKLTVYDQSFQCSMDSVLGSSGSSYQFQLSSRNTCGFLKVDPTGKVIEGIPDDSNVGTCNLVYVVKTAGWTSTDFIQSISVINRAAKWIKTPTDMTIQEISRNDVAVGGANASAPNPTTLAPNVVYTAHVLSSQINTDKAAQGLMKGKVFGSYKIRPTNDTCSNFGTVFSSPQYFATSGATNPHEGINPITGEVYFQPLEYFQGKCTLTIYFDDGHATSNLSSDYVININVIGYNDPPVISSGPVASGGIYNCGAQCYTGISYEAVFTTHAGGINSAYPLITGEPDQKTFLKPGNCVSSDPSLHIPYCTLDPRTGRVVIQFKATSIPTTMPTIRLVVSDTGDHTNPGMPSAANPKLTGTSNTCLTGGTTCQTFPKSNLDSQVYSFKVDVGSFNLPLKPALIIRQGACLMCHANITGDVITDFADTVAKNRFSIDSGEATEAIGWGSIDRLDGTLYVKRAEFTRAKNPGFMDSTSYQAPSGTMLEKPLSASVPLVDFLKSPSWKRNGSAFINSSWVPKARSYVAVCDKQGTVFDGNGKWGQCITDPARIPTIKDVLPSNEPMEFMTISSPIATDIQQMAQKSNGLASAINWSSSSPDVQPTYMVGPFSGLSVSSTQPAATVFPGETPKTTSAPYVRNEKGTAIECYGDVIVKGNLFLDSPTFKTDTGGCTLYVDGVVIFHGENQKDGITVLNTEGSNPNAGGWVAISSDRAILFGMSLRMMDDARRWYNTDGRTGIESAAMSFGRSIFVPQGDECFKSSTNEVFKTCTPSAAEGLLKLSGFTTTNALYNDNTAPTVPGLAGWDWGTVNYSKLMVNAPNIGSRYLGSFKGSIIVDYALFRLGNLTFTFDTVFQGVVPFPRLQTIKSTENQLPRVIFDAGRCSGPTDPRCL